jgi:hypothetical protein
MGIYELFIGKGIIVPASLVYKYYRSELCDTKVELIDDFSDIIEDKFGCSISQLGHDALEGRHDMILFDDDERNNIIENLKSEILNLADCADPSNEDSPFSNKDLMFIGEYKSLDAHEFSYYVKAPEIIYGLSALLPNILALYPKYNEMNIGGLEATFAQKPLVWIFAGDCACCG